MTNSNTTSRSSRVRQLEVLEAAAKVLNGRGVSQTSLAEIADRLGVSRPALYYYFEDQQDLVFQCYRQSCERMTDSLNQAMSSNTDAMARIENFIDLLLAEGSPECAALSDVAFLRPKQQRTILRLFEAVRAGIAELLKQGAIEHQLRSCQPGVVAAAIIGVVSWLPTSRRLPTSRILSQEDLLDATKSMLRMGIAADRSAPVKYHAHVLSPMILPAVRVFEGNLLSAARREAVAAAASWLFNIKGVDATSLEEIAARLGVTKKVIYHNVGDKETLVAECYQRSFRMSEEHAKRMADYNGLGIDAISANHHALAEASLREDVTPMALLAGLEALPENSKKELQVSSERLMQTYLEVYAKGQADGSIRSVHSRAMMNINPGTFEWLPKWVDAFDPLERVAAPREVAELLRLGLMPLKLPSARKQSQSIESSESTRAHKAIRSDSRPLRKKRSSVKN